MKNINRVTLMGHLAAEPEFKVTQNGKKVCTAVLATNNEWTDNEGQVQKSVDFHRVVSWDQLAERCHRELKKGSPVWAEGRLSNRSYEGKDAVRHYITEVNLQNMYVIEWQEKNQRVETRELAEAASVA